MKENKKVIIAIILLIILMFISAYDRIHYINSGIQILNDSNPTEDVNIEAVRATVSNYTGYDTFINGIGKGLIPIATIICPLILGYLFAGRFAYELKTGYGNMVITRQKFKQYFINIVKKTFMKSFLVVFFAETIFLIMCLLIFGWKTPVELHTQVFDSISWMFYKIPFLYCLIHVFKQSLYMSIITIIGMTSTIFTRNKFIIALSPFIVYLLINIVCPILDMIIDASALKMIYPDYLILSFMTGTYFMDNPIIHNICGFAIYIIIAVVLLVIMYKKYNKNYLR